MTHPRAVADFASAAEASIQCPYCQEVARRDGRSLIHRDNRLIDWYRKHIAHCPARTQEVPQ